MPGDYYVSAIARNRRRTSSADGVRPVRRRGGGPRRRRRRGRARLRADLFPRRAVGGQKRSRSASASARKCSTSISTCSSCAPRASAASSPNPGRHAATSGNVSLIAETAAGRGGADRRCSYGGRIDWDGSFSIGNVPPGRYMLRARGDDTERRSSRRSRSASARCDLSDVTRDAAAGRRRISGTLAFPATQRSAPGSHAVPDRRAVARRRHRPGRRAARVDKDGHFTSMASRPARI